MSQITIWHKVKDYNIWKAGFDKDSDRRTGAGLKEVYVGPGKIDPNSAFVVLEGNNAEEIMAGMLSDPGLKSKMEDAGVIEFDYAVG